MANLVDIFAEVGANLIGDDSNPTFTIKNSSTGRALDLDSVGAISMKASAIVAGPILDLYVSSASGSNFKVNNIDKGYVSTNSCATLSYAMTVDVGGKIFYIPLYLGKA